MKILFWNVQRLGHGTPQERKDAFTYLYEKRVKPDLALFCELLPGGGFPKPNNLTYRRESIYQLCYGCLDENFADVPLASYTPDSTAEYQQAAFKGGNYFPNLVDRSVGYLGNHGGVEMYVFHAPATSGSARRAMSFLACDLDLKHGLHPWLVIGDFNVEPDRLSLTDVGIELSCLVASPSEPTKISAKGDKTYDYVLCNFIDDVKVARIRCSPRTMGSDHYPILVEF